MRFVQFYFGLPIAMVILCVHRGAALPSRRTSTPPTNIWSAASTRATRALVSGIFLMQRGLALGITLYAPAVVLTVILGWPDWMTTLADRRPRGRLHDGRAARRRSPGPTCSRCSS